LNDWLGLGMLARIGGQDPPMDKPQVAARAQTRREFLMRATAGLVASVGLTLLDACAPGTPVAPTAAPQAPATGAAPAQSSTPPASTAAQQAPATAQPSAGGTLTVSQSVDINTLHPWVGTLNVWKVIKENVYDQLSYQDPTTFEVKPKLAKSFEWTDGNTSLLITLPGGTSFHNGDSLTADDVKSTLDGIRDPQVGSWLRGFLAPIKDVQVVDPTHVKLKTETVDNGLVPALTYVDIVPRGAGTDLAKQNPIGSGPFKFIEWVPNDRIVLERNPKYWDQARQPKLDKIVFRPVTELQTRISQLLAGNVDMVYDFSLQEVPRLQADKRVVVSVVPPADQMFIAYLNMRKPPFDKLEMRQAIAWSLDRQAFVTNFLAGLGNPTGNSPFTDKHWAYEPKTKDRYAYDLDKVGQLVEKAGYPKGQGLNFTLLVPSGYPEFKQISTLIQASFASVGYQPPIEEVEIGQWAARINQTRDFFIAVDYPPRGTADPALTYNAGQLFAPNAANAGGLTPETIPGYVDALHEGATITDQTKRKDAYSRAQLLWVDALPGPIFAHRSTAHALTPAIKGFTPHPAFQQDFASASREK